jgi:hypothetical protein
MDSVLMSLLLLISMIYLLIRLIKKSSKKQYERKPKNQWNSLSDGIDPTQSKK